MALPKKVFLDTNIIMDTPDIYEDYELCLMSIVTLEEIDKLKQSTNEERAFKAREASRCLLKADNVEIIIEYNDDIKLDLNINDNKILACAKQEFDKDNEIVLLTNDINVYFKAKALELNVELYESQQKNEVYQGFKEVTLDDYNLANLYQNLEENTYDLLPNQYLIIKQFNKIVDKLRWNGEKLVKLKLPNIKGLKSKHYLQDCAMDLLNNPNIPIKIIMGTYGSGKTYLSTKTSLHHVLDKGIFSKILVVREPLGEGTGIGYLKGTKDDKTADFFKPIEQSLEDTMFQLNSLESNGTLEKEIPYFLKGTTYNKTIIIVDEAEDLTYKQLRLVGTRVGQDGNIIFSGDYKQSVRNDSRSNGLIRLANKLKGNPLFGIVDLTEDVRSETSKVFAELD